MVVSLEEGRVVVVFDFGSGSHHIKYISMLYYLCYGRILLNVFKSILFIYINNIISKVYV